MNQEKLDIARARAMGFLLGLIEYDYIPAHFKEAALDILREYNEAIDDTLSTSSRQQHDERREGLPAEGQPLPLTGVEAPG
jgi:hypothetical protein